MTNYSMPAPDPQNTGIKRRGRRQRKPGDPYSGQSTAMNTNHELNEYDIWDESQSPYPPRESAPGTSSPVPQPYSPHPQRSSQPRQQPLPGGVRPAGNRGIQLPTFGAPLPSPPGERTAYGADASLVPNDDESYPPEGYASRGYPAARSSPKPEAKPSARRSPPVSSHYPVAPQPHPAQPSPPQPSEDSGDSGTPQVFWMQVQRVNHLASNLEAALLELQAIALGMHSPDQEDDPNRGSDPDRLRWDADAAIVPYVQPELDAYVVRTRAVYLAEVTPKAMAPPLPLGQRSWPSAVQSSDQASSLDQPNDPDFLVNLPQPAFPPEVPSTALDPPYRDYPANATTKNRQAPRWLLRLIQLPSTALGMINDGVSWVVAAGVLRIGLELIRLITPTLWLPALLLVVALLVWTVYQGMATPKAKVLLAYRLVLLAIGFALGGKFWSR